MGSYSVEVSTEVRQIVYFNPKRVSLIIFNNGDVTAYLSQDPVKVKERGIPLLAGSSLTLLKIEGDQPEYQWYAQTISDKTELRIYEVFG